MLFINTVVNMYILQALKHFLSFLKLIFFLVSLRNMSIFKFLFQLFRSNKAA